jgi:hypothetical protein
VGRVGAVVSRTLSKPLPKTAELNFLLGASEKDLSSFELARLAAVADHRADLHAILDKLIDEMAQAAVSHWFRQIDRGTLIQALNASPEEHTEEILAWAKERIRDGQRSDEELIPLTALAPSPRLESSGPVAGRAFHGLQDSFPHYRAEGIKGHCLRPARFSALEKGRAATGSGISKFELASITRRYDAAQRLFNSED